MKNTHKLSFDHLVQRVVTSTETVLNYLWIPTLSFQANISTGLHVDYTEDINSINFKTIHSQSAVADQRVVHAFDYTDTWSESELTTNKPLRVMMLGLRGFPNVQGGVETHAEHLAPLLVNFGCHLEVIARSPYQDKAIGKKWRGVRFTSLWAPKSKGFEAIVHSFLGVLYAAVKRPDILHIHAIGPALMTPVARLLGLKVIVTHHGPDYDRQKWGAFARNVLLLGEWMGMRFSNGRIVISNVIRELVIRKHRMTSSLIRNGVVMPDTTASEDHLKQFDVIKNQYILLVSRLVPEKRHLDLINAFNQANLTNYKLVLVGSCDHPDTYAKIIINAAASNPNVVMTGYQTGDTLQALYAYAAMFVLPSSHEGLSISLLEALSYGLPVIASNIPANLELHLNPRCYFGLGNIEELALLIKENAKTPISIERRKNIRDWVDSRYNWKVIAEETYNEYRRVLK